MAKLIKITGYLIADDTINEHDIKNSAGEILASRFDCIKAPFTVESAHLCDSLVTEEWNNHPLNSINSTFSDCEKYFNEGRK